MDVRELRIGNYIDSIYFDNITHKVVEIRDCVVYTEKYKGISFPSIKPIPLTEEWLIKFGFKKVEDGGFKHPNIHFILYGCEGEYSFCTVEGYDINDRIKFVNQLQNLCYALTGEELKI